MTKHKHIPAFTILEIGLSMVISGILIALVYSVVNFFAYQSNADMKQSLIVNNWLLFRHQFYEDIYLSEHILVEENSIFMQKLGNEITYKIEDETFIKVINGKEINLEYKNVTLVCSEATEDDITACILYVPVLEEPMQLIFSTYQDRATRVNEWHKKRLNYE
jgi:hypothetical protein